MFVPTVAADKKGDGDVRYIPSGSSSRREERCMVLFNIQSLIGRAGLRAPDNGLAVLCLVENGFHDRLPLMDLRLALTNDWADLQSRLFKARRLEERVRETEDDSEGLRVLLARVDELTAGSESMTTGTEQEKEKCDTLATHIRDLEVAATTRDGELGILGRPMRSLKVRVAAGKAWAYAVEGRVHETLNRCPNFAHLSKG